MTEPSTEPVQRYRDEASTLTARFAGAAQWPLPLDADLLSPEGPAQQQNPAIAFPDRNSAAIRNKQQ